MAWDYPVIWIFIFGFLFLGILYFVYRLTFGRSKHANISTSSTAERDRNAGLFGGVFFLLLAIVAAMGSISLGSYQIPIQGEQITGSYLVTNYNFVLIALGLSALSAYFIYRAGQDSMRHKASKEINDKKESSISA